MLKRTTLFTFRIQMNQIMEYYHMQFCVLVVSSPFFECLSRNIMCAQFEIDEWKNGAVNRFIRCRQFVFSYFSSIES